MKEDMFELLGSEERMERFAAEYIKYPVLWDKNNKKHKVKSARATALRRLRAALGARCVVGGAGGKGFSAVVREFRARLKREVVAACAEAARRGGAAGGSWRAARELLPVWARAAARCLPEMKPAPSVAPAGPSAGREPPTAAPNAASARTRRVVRAVRRAAREHGVLGARELARAAAQLGEHVADVQDLWSRLQRAALCAVRARAARGDAAGGAPLPAAAWAAADLALAYHAPPMLTTMHYQQYKALRGLLATFHLVQRCGLEPAPGEPPPPPRRWVHAAAWYSREPARAALSALALQRRWFELRADTQRRLRAAWRRAAAPGGAAGQEEPGARDKVLALHEAIARRYPHVVTEESPSWGQLLHDGQLAPPTNECGPAPGETERSCAYTDSDSDETDDDRLIVIQDENLQVDKDETNEQKNDSRTTANAQIDVKTDLETGKPDDNIGLKMENSTAPAKDDSKTENATEDNVDLTDSDGDLQIDESRDTSENVVKALQRLDPRAVQASVVFVSDDDDQDAPDDAGKEEQAQHTHKIQTEKVERQRQSKNSSVANCESVEESAGASSKNKSNVKVNSNSNKVSESHKSISKKAVQLKSELSDSDDDVLVIDDWKDENYDLNNADRITAIEEEMFKDSSNGSTSKDEVKSEDDSNVKLSDAVDSNCKGDPSYNPILSHLLTAKFDVFKRYHDASNLDNISRRLTPENVPTRECTQKYVMNIKSELLDQGAGSSTEANNFEGGIDPKLLMYPVVLLTKLEDMKQPESPKPLTPAHTGKLSPKLLASKIHMETLSTLSETFFSIKRNIEMLKRCQPCVVVLARRERKSRVAKRVELPDIEEVRRNNRSMLTAQVAPLAQQKSAAGGAAEGDAPSREELQRLLDDFAGGPTREVCKNRNTNSEAPCGCARCAWRLLAAPARDAAAATGQARVLLRAAASHRKHFSERARKRVSVLATPVQKNFAERARKRAAGRQKPPPPPAAPRAPSPYDPERAARDWLREKNLAAEKFGVKPRCFKKKPAPAPNEPATITPLNPPTEPAPPAEPAGDRPPRLSNFGAPPGVAYLPLSEEVLIREAQNQPIFKITPTIFNVEAVADINKKLGDLASTDRPGPSSEPTFSPIITNVQSLAREERSQARPQQICWLTKKTEDGPLLKETRPFLTLTNGRLADHVPKIVVNRSQLKPPIDESRSLLNSRVTSDEAAQTPDTDGSKPNRPDAGLSNSGRVDPAVASNEPPNRTSETSASALADSSPTGAAPTQPASRLTSVYSGPSDRLTGALQAPWIVTAVSAAPAIVVGAPSSISQTAFENMTAPLGLNMNQNVLQTSQQSPVISAMPLGTQLQLVLTPGLALLPGAAGAAGGAAGGAGGAPLQRDANALPVSSVRSAPARAAERPGTALQVNSVQAGPQTVRTLSQEQFRGLQQLNKIQASAGAPRAPPPAPPPAPPAPAPPTPGFRMIPAASQTGAPRLYQAFSHAGSIRLVPAVSQADGPRVVQAFAKAGRIGLFPAPQSTALGAAPAAPDASAPPAAPPGPGADKRKMPEYEDEIFNEAEWPGLGAVPAVPASRLGAAEPAVLAARRGAWRVARHLVLKEASAPPARAALYSLRPLQRILLDDDEEPPAKQSRPPQPWLKVKAFAKMVDDDDGQTSRCAEQPAGSDLSGRGLVVQGVAYLWLCDNPQVYAKVLEPVSGAREATALLMRGAPLSLFAPHRAARAPLRGQLDARGTSIVLTGPADMSEALGALALQLNPLDAAPRAPARPATPATPATPPPPDPPEGYTVVNITAPRSFKKLSKEPLVLPKTVLNSQSSADVSVEAVRVASDPESDTYHLILNDLHPESATPAREEARVVGGVIDLSSDEELSV